MNTRRSVALLAGLAIALTGCANGPGATTDNQESGSGQSEKSPLEEYLGSSPLATSGKSGGPATVIKIGGDSDSEESRAQQREVEDLVATCMQKEGFTYVPVQPDTGGKSKLDEAYELPPDKFAEQYGYGITTLGWIQDPNGGDADTDPNREIRDKLSDQAKQAYDKALNGSGGEVAISSSTGDGGGVVQRGTSSKDGKNGDLGCRGKAMEQVHGKPDKDQVGKQMEKFESLFDDIEALRKRIESDPRLQKASQAWSDCMADQDYKFDKPEDARQSVSQRLERLFGLPTEGEGEATEMKKPDPKEVAKIKPYELAVAKADYACSEQHYTKTYRTVQFELESAFVKDHKAELEAYRDFMAELQSPQASPTKGSK